VLTRTIESNIYVDSPMRLLHKSDAIRVLGPEIEGSAEHKVRIFAAILTRICVNFVCQCVLVPSHPVLCFAAKRIDTGQREYEES
jgi:hypothetical protein